MAGHETPASCDTASASAAAQRFGERGACPRQPLARGIETDLEHGRGRATSQALHADQQQDLAVDVGKRRERALEVASAASSLGAASPRARRPRRRARGDDVGAPPRHDTERLRATVKIQAARSVSGASCAACRAIEIQTLLVQILGDVAPSGESQQETEARLREARVQLPKGRALTPPQAVDEPGVAAATSK